MKQLKHYFLVVLFLVASLGLSAQVTVKGEKKQWHKITLEVNGPSVSESDSPSPFLEYKLTGIFTKGSKRYEIPGYFAADGDAANTGATSGKKWRIHFAPSETGTWNYTIRFRKGTNVAVSSSISAGSAVSGLDNVTGSFSVSASDKSYPDMRSRGCLQYVGKHHLKFANGEWYLKAGPDSPENLLAYADFDNTPDNGGLRKTYSPHTKDWKSGNPTWKNGKGKGLIGAVNYLASKGMNSVSFLTMSAPKGDDKNVFMWTATNKMTQFDCSKLDQWEIVMAHAEAMGMHLHFKTQETENELQLDNGSMGNKRKVYYRELIARFSHHNALNWNICEEGGAGFSNTNQTQAQRKECIAYFRDNDAYGHNVVVHTAPNLSNEKKIYNDMLGTKSKLTGVSIQCHYDNVHGDTKHWVEQSAANNVKWVVANDEQGGAQIGVPYDSFTGSPNINDIREETLWGNLMAGGAGVEYYFGYGAKVINNQKDDKMFNSSDMRCQDFRTRDKSWGYAKLALDFFNQYVPFWDMKNGDNKTNKGWCLYKDGACYVVYLPSGGNPTVQLKSGKKYNVKWYNPRTGGDLIAGKTNLSGGSVAIGSAPDSKNDWVALVSATDFSHTPNGETSDGGETVLGVNLNSTSVQLESVGDTYKLEASVYPSSALNKSVTWSSNNTSVATVSSTGLVTAKAKGNATITVKTVDGSKKATASISVGASSEPVAGETKKLTPIYDAYLQGSTRYNTTELRLEGGKRVSYLQFDLSSISQSVSAATLTLGVGNDGGSGEIKAYVGNSNSWTESNLSSSNAPSKGSLLGSVNKTYSVGNSYTWELDASLVKSGGKLSIILEHVSGNDVSFQSKEANGVKPQLAITLGETAPPTVTEKAELLSLPDAFDSALEIPVTVRYTAKEARDVVARLHSPAGAWLGSAKQTVAAGSGQLDMVIKLSALPAAAIDYKIIADVRPVGGAAADAVVSATELVDINGGTVTPDPDPDPVGGTFTLSPIHDAYVQGSNGYNATIMRIEKDKRVGYLQFDLGSLSGDVTSASLALTINGDSGSGLIAVYKGNSSSWTESNLNSSNAPSTGNKLGQFGGSGVSHGIGKVCTFDLDESLINSGEKLTLVVKLEGTSNDLAFAAKEHATVSLRPVLTVKASGSSTKRGAIDVEENVSVCSTKVYPNPFFDHLTISNLDRSVQRIRVFDVTGQLVSAKALANGQSELSLGSSDLTNPGLYILQIVKTTGVETMKIIKK